MEFRWHLEVDRGHEGEPRASRGRVCRGLGQMIHHEYQELHSRSHWHVEKTELHCCAHGSRLDESTRQRANARQVERSQGNQYTRCITSTAVTSGLYSHLLLAFSVFLQSPRFRGRIPGCDVVICEFDWPLCSFLFIIQGQYKVSRVDERLASSRIWV